MLPKGIPVAAPTSPSLHVNGEYLPNDWNNIFILLQSQRPCEIIAIIRIPCVSWLIYILVRRTYASVYYEISETNEATSKTMRNLYGWIS